MVTAIERDGTGEGLDLALTAAFAEPLLPAAAAFLVFMNSAWFAIARSLRFRLDSLSDNPPLIITLCCETEPFRSTVNERRHARP